MLTRRLIPGLFSLLAGFVVFPLGCGAGSEDYVVVSRPSEQASTNASAHAAQVPQKTVHKLQQCIDRYDGRLSGYSYALRYKVVVTDRGAVVRVDLRDATLQNAEAEACFRGVLAEMEVPKEALEIRSSRAFSGGEKMTREQRGLVGSDSETPLVILAPVILESVGTQAIIEIALLIAAAVTHVIDAPKDPKEECAEEYAKCLLSDTADKKGGSDGQTRCYWCNQGCMRNGGTWPFTVTGVRRRPYRCDYWRR